MMKRKKEINESMEETNICDFLIREARGLASAIRNSLKQSLASSYYLSFFFSCLFVV